MNRIDADASSALPESTAERAQRLIWEDAKRYRWLKAQKGHNIYLRRVEGSVEVTVFVYMAEALDEAIQHCIDEQRGVKPSLQTGGDSK